MFIAIHLTLNIILSVQSLSYKETSNSYIYLWKYFTNFNITTLKYTQWLPIIEDKEEWMNRMVVVVRELLTTI